MFVTPFKVYKVTPDIVTKKFALIKMYYVCLHHAGNDRGSIFDFHDVILFPTKNQNFSFYDVTRQLSFADGINAAGDWSLLDLVQSPTVDRYFLSHFSALSMCLALETIRLRYILLSKSWTKMFYICSVMPIWWSKVRLLLTIIWKSAVRGRKLGPYCCWYRYPLKGSVRGPVWRQYQLLENDL